MFLTPKRSIKPFDDIWFSKTIVGRNTIAFMELIIANIEKLKGKRIINKIGCGIDNMEKMGHRNVKSYNKYNQTNKEIIDRMLQCIVARETFHGKNFTYQKVFDQEIDKYQVIEVFDLPNLC
jgi:hypothetical protein